MNDKYLIGLADKLMKADRRSLAQAISIAENGGRDADILMRQVADNFPEVDTIGITGPPGAGKSTLINAMVGVARKRGLQVAILAVDPSSPISGGAVLGDRTRMIDHADDDGVFFRSVAARGHLGGLCLNVQDIVDVMAAAGWDLIILETVGAGQSEVEIAQIADINIVAAAPGLGDDVQAIKAGILEIADILVVNKADNDGAEETQRQLIAMTRLRKPEAADVAVLKTVATSHEGVEALFDHACGLLSHQEPGFRMVQRQRRAKQALADRVADRVRNHIIHSESDELDELLEAATSRTASTHEIETRLLRDLLTELAAKSDT